jgi:uncharacterized protein (TIGR00297 family)
MTPESSAALWTKAIPPVRDRLQSHLLVWIVVPVLCVMAFQTLWFSLFQGHSWWTHTVAVLMVSVVFGVAAFALKAATSAAAACGTLICLLLTFYTGSVIQSPLRSALAPLLALFVLTFVATRAGRKRKADHGLGESRKGRSASQVVANLSVAALISSPLGVTVVRFGQQLSKGPAFDSYWLLCTLILASLAEAAADTVSSEVGQAYGGTPFLLTTLRKVEPGVDGAISPSGTAAGILAAAIVTGVGAWSMHLHTDQVRIAFMAAVLGLLFDSLLGATIERRGWIGNDLVNFASTAFAAGIGIALIPFA